MSGWRVHWWPLCLMRYTDDLPTFTVDGVGYEVAGRMVARGVPMVEVRTAHAADVGLRKHEFCHAAQFWWAALMCTAVGILLAALMPWPVGVAVCVLVSLVLAPVIDMLLYRNVRRYRLYAEVEAYREQMLWPDKRGGYLSMEGAAELLALPRYRLGLTRAEALRELMGR